MKRWQRTCVVCRLATRQRKLEICRVWSSISDIVWTVNDEYTMLDFINKGVDLITTDEAEKALVLLEKPFVSDK